MHSYFEYEKTALVDSRIVNYHAQQLVAEIERIQSARDTGYQTVYAALNVPFDECMIMRIKELVVVKKKLMPSMVIVIGIGGSYLATKALYQVLHEQSTSLNHQVPIQLYFADTVDSDLIQCIVNRACNELARGKNIILSVVSKSGTTLETIANFEIFLSALKQYKADCYQDYIVVTTDEGSRLWEWANQENIPVLCIPTHVGGRYSAFSAVSLFPLAMVDVDIVQLCKGAQYGFEQAVSENVAKNTALVRAALMYTHYMQSYRIHDLFLFSVDFEGVGMWYRQLMAESLGKAGQGMLPTVSLGSADLHSMIQLYLASSIKRFTTFVCVEKNKSSLIVPKYDSFQSLVSNIQGVPLDTIMRSIFESVRMVYINNSLPFCSFFIPEKSAFHIGQLMQTMMIEIMYFGFLLKINPFDQPQVEQYKRETKKLLAEGRV
jgi:glucose-6-phosphate isomerase